MFSRLCGCTSGGFLGRLSSCKRRRLKCSLTSRGRSFSRLRRGFFRAGAGGTCSADGLLIGVLRGGFPGRFLRRSRNDALGGGHCCLTSHACGLGCLFSRFCRLLGCGLCVFGALGNCRFFKFTCNLCKVLCFVGSPACLIHGNGTLTVLEPGCGLGGDPAGLLCRRHTRIQNRLIDEFDFLKAYAGFLGKLCIDSFLIGGIDLFTRIDDGSIDADGCVQFAINDILHGQFRAVDSIQPFTDQPLCFGLRGRGNGFDIIRFETKIHRLQ